MHVQDIDQHLEAARKRRGRGLRAEVKQFYSRLRYYFYRYKISRTEYGPTFLAVERMVFALAEHDLLTERHADFVRFLEAMYAGGFVAEEQLSPQQIIQKFLPGTETRESAVVSPECKSEALSEDVEESVFNPDVESVRLPLDATLPLKNIQLALERFLVPAELKEPMRETRWPKRLRQLKIIHLLFGSGSVLEKDKHIAKAYEVLKALGESLPELPTSLARDFREVYVRESRVAAFTIGDVIECNCD